MVSQFETPSLYGDEVSRGGTARIIRFRDVASIPIDEEVISQVEGLLTPLVLLQATEFETPELIYPSAYPTFDALLAERGRISTLGLMPIKTDEDNRVYKEQPKDALLDLVSGYLDGDVFALAPNKFPHDLPPDVQQRVVWIQNRSSDTHEIALFIARCMRRLGVIGDRLILFERPTGAGVRGVRPTFPVLRHVHFLTDKCRD